MKQRTDQTLLTIELRDSLLDNPFRTVSISRDEEPADLEETLNKMYAELKKSYLNIKCENAHVVHKYREDGEYDNELHHAG